MSENDGKATDEQAAALDKIEVEETNENGAEREPFISFKSKAEFQEAIDARLRERMERFERKQADEKAQTEADARQKALEENEQYKELAEERQGTITELTARVEDLTPYKESVERYKGVVDSQLEAQKKDLPPYIASLLEGKDSVEQLEWLRENREQIVGDKPAGSRGTPRPADRQPDGQADKEAEAASRQRISARL